VCENRLIAHWVKESAFQKTWGASVLWQRPTWSVGGVASQPWQFSTWWNSYAHCHFRASVFGLL